MQINFEQLPTQLQKQLAPLYFISSDEAVLIDEAVQLIRAAAIKQGFQQRQWATVDTDFDWQEWLMGAKNLSLFSEKTFLELQIPAAKFNETTKKNLLAYSQALPRDKILVIRTDKLDSKAQQSTWFTQFTQPAIFILRYPLNPQQLARWIAEKLQQADLQVDATGIKLLIELTSGNLLASQQAIEKLSLFYGKANLSAEEILPVVTESSRYDLFQWVDLLLAGDLEKTVTILQYLKAEGVEATLVLWAITRELRLLIQMHTLQQQGKSLENVMQQMHVWEKRKIFYKKAFNRYTLSKLYGFLPSLAQIDQQIKGISLGDAWQSLEQLSLALAGVELFHENNLA